MKRSQTEKIIQDLPKKIVFLVGPRQVGKTWLAKEIAKGFENAVYLNYDHQGDREVIKKEAWREKTELLVLDELHKMPDWKNYLKGVFDTRQPNLKILVTGSARLDFMRQSGDSLAGRFFTHRLLPFSLRELEGTQFAGNLERLIERSGFPEPFLAGDPPDAERWRRQYVDGLVRADILDFEAIHDLRAMMLLLAMLRQRVGSPVSHTSIARDIGISPSTVIKYLQILEALYIVFRVTPWSHNIARSLLKEPKIYFFDTGMVDGSAGIRFENCMAVSLVKHLYGLADYRGEESGLFYVRTKDGREIDFCLVKKNELEALIECKSSENTVSPHLHYFCGKYRLKGVQVVQELRTERSAAGGLIEVRRASEYINELFM
jgi:predicted AAA+ superfamily ATPase